MWMGFNQALLRLGLLLNLTIAYGNGWYRDGHVDFVDSAPIEFDLYPQDHLHIVVNWTADNMLQNVAYEIQVSRTENFNVIESVNISTKPQESHNWTWASKLPLQCTDHSVRMRRVYNSSFVGSWSLWKSHLGVHEYEDKPWDYPKIFPSQEVLQEKSEVYFCCIAPRKTQVTHIHFKRREYPLINISSQVKAIAVDHLNISSEFGVIFECDISSGTGNYTVNFVTFPPQKPKNLSCETEDLRRWWCTWDPARKPNLLQNIAHQRRYTLHVQNSGHSPLRCETSSCSFQAFPHLHEYVVTVEFANNLGKETDSIKFSALDRVFPVVKGFSVIHGVTEANISWTLEGNFTTIQMICQVEISPEKNIKHIEQTGGLVIPFACQLEDLKASTEYSVKARCAVSGKRWGKWTKPLVFTTHPLVLVDVWRSIQALPSSRHVVIIWRTYTTGSLSDVTSYEVQLQQKSKLGTLWTNATRIKPQVSQSEFFIDERGYNISVCASIAVGTSVPAHILIPPAEHTEKAVRIPKRLVGNSSTGFNLSWSEDVSAVCGYTIEWCQNGTGVVPCTPSNLRWKTVQQSNTSLSLEAGEFCSGRRYTFNIFGCRGDGHGLIETYIGFLEETRPTQFVQIKNSLVVTSSSVKIEWSFPEDDPQHPCFITGYIVIFQERHMSDQNSNSKVSVDSPYSKSLKIHGLQESTEYNLCIHARSSVGLGPPTCNMFRTSPDQTLFLVKIVISTVFIFGCCVLLWSFWKRLRSTIVEIFTHPSKMNVKIVELDSCLYETSKRIQAICVEDCMCCDLEVLDSRTGVAEPRFQASDLNEEDSPFVPLTVNGCKEQLYNNVWDDNISEQAMTLCNFTYSPTLTEISFCLSSSSSEAPSVGRLVQPHNDGMCDYVQSPLKASPLTRRPSW